GAALQVNVAGAVSRSGSLQLAPAVGVRISHMPAERAMTLWKKRLAATVKWPALPTGRYDLLFIPEDGPGDAISLASLDIGPTTTQQLSIEIPAAELFAAISAKVKFLLTDRPPAELRFRVTRWISEGAMEVPSHIQHLSGGDILEVTAPCLAG